ncbi:alpha-1,3-arabinosyltransferase XAT3-like [Curcuma longa]|uniref:alpha-1,3-arabinosyltransferase XAT3-like n=1 Tax=Curcuma longa TaxID=136217 RepID=UPI003D9F8ED8
MGCENKFCRRLSSRKHRKLLHLSLLAACCLISATLYVRYSIIFPKLSSWLRNRAAPDTPPSGVISLDHRLGEFVRKQELKQGKVPLCDFSKRRSNVCELEGDIRVHGANSSVLVARPKDVESRGSWLIKPHPRKEDPYAMSHVTEISVKSIADRAHAPECSTRSSAPAIIFSTGGYTGNAFHDFTDVLIPLFITTSQFDGGVQFLVLDIAPWWIQKYDSILKRLSRHRIIDLSKDNSVRCFSRAVVGLKFHKEMSVDAATSPEGVSMPDFGRLLRETFALKRQSAIKLGGPDREKKPRLMIIARTRTRRFKNVDEIVRAARELGFEVVVTDTERESDLSEFAQLVNSCDVMMGVHGAGLANLVFLPTNAVLIQVVPLGEMDDISRVDFGEPALDLKIRYLHYSITEEESSLIDQYPRDHPVLKEPRSIARQGWIVRRSVYLVKQDVKLNMARFRGFMLQALQYLH